MTRDIALGAHLFKLALGRHCCRRNHLSSWKASQMLYLDNLTPAQYRGRYEAGGDIMIIESIKMEIHVTAVSGGTISAARGQIVRAGERLGVIIA